MTRRGTIWFITTTLATLAFGRPKLGDDAWMRNFREFVRAFNDFVLALDDKKLDRAKWERMRTIWREIDID